MEVRNRRILVLALTGAFLAQTWIVYTDPAGRASAPLSAQAARGRELWHASNCQSCHQLYGFGGFLGPDLTNLASRAAGQDREARAAALETRLATVLTTGSERMPAFHFSPADRDAMAAFLVAVDLTGVGQVQVGEARPAREVLEGLVDVLAVQEPLGELELAGQRLVLEAACIDCHLPNARSAFRSPDLTRVHPTLGPAALRQVLSEGRPLKGMPSFGYDAQQLEQVLAFLARLARGGPLVREGFQRAEAASTGSLAGLPWFEYP